VGTVFTSFVSSVHPFAGQVTVCLIALLCFHGVTSGYFSKRLIHLLYIQICSCLLHNVTGAVWHNAMPCYSHASHIGSDTDSNSKSSDSSLNRNDTSSSDKSGNSQQRRVAVCTSQCSKGVEAWSLLWPEVRATSTGNQLMMHACSTSL